MGLKICQQLVSKIVNYFTTTKLAETFRVLTSTILSFLFPLSFLLLAKLTTARFLLTLGRINNLSFFASLFLDQTPLVVILHSIISVITVPALVHSLAGLIRPVRLTVTMPCGPHLLGTWVLLWTFQICVGIGIECSIASGVGVVNFDGLEGHYSWGRQLCLLFFFVGLHETTRHWTRMVVRPVVDDTVYGEAKEESMAEIVGVAAGFGVLWWCRMREEVESLIFVVRWKKELVMEIGIADTFGWWLYCFTMIIGMVKILMGLRTMGRILFIWLRIEQIDYVHMMNVDVVEKV